MQPICRKPSEVPAVPCPCGQSRRIITAADGALVGFHITEIRDAQAHYHARGTEVYHVLAGGGALEIAGSSWELRPGTVAYIPPGCLHRGTGDFIAAIAVLPPFDPADEYTLADGLPRPLCAPIVRHLDDIEPARSACGSSRRVLTRADGVALGLHVVHIQATECHYHERTTEIYHVLEGGGTLTVGEMTCALEPGVTVYVPAGSPHGGEGDFTAIVICAPPFDPDDQIVVS